MIPTLWPLAVTVNPGNERMHLLLRKERANSITAPEMLELNLIFKAMDADQDTQGEG